MSVQATAETEINVGPGPEPTSLSLLLQGGEKQLHVNFKKKVIFTFYAALFPRISFPDANRIWSSPTRRNFTRIMNDIMFSGGSNKSLGTFSPSGALLTLFFTMLAYLYWAKCRIPLILGLIRYFFILFWSVGIYWQYLYWRSPTKYYCISHIVYGQCKIKIFWIIYFLP